MCCQQVWNAIGTVVDPVQMCDELNQRMHSESSNSQFQIGVNYGGRFWSSSS